EAAWAQTFARAGLGGVGPGVGGTDADGVPPKLAWLEEATRAGLPAERAALAATVAACRLTHELGAPLADVLERCAHGITEAAQAQDARRVALAGPRSTARLLGWLPVAGLLLGTGMG